jgi:drug/metabolite transporter (DMT)-like permease
LAADRSSASPTPAQVHRGLLLGLLGVVMFAMTFPMTRLAVGDVSAPQMSPEFVTAARAALAGLLSIGYLRWVGASVPARQHWAPLAVCAAGTVVGFPLCIALALREVESTHAYVSLFSMWLGFFAWYGGLALGGIVRVSQVQLLQPFLALLFAVPVLGEQLDPVTVGFSLAVIAWCSSAGAWR